MEEFKKEYFEKIKNDPSEEKCYCCKDPIRECNHKYESMKFGGVYSLGMMNNEARRIKCDGYNKRKLEVINKNKINENPIDNIFRISRTQNKHLRFGINY